MTSYHLTDGWSSSISLAAAREACVSYVLKREGRLRGTSESVIQAEFGSRRDLRLWGRSTDGRSLPMRLQLQLDEDGVVRIDAKVESDEGWYLFRLKRLGQMYTEEFRAMMNELREVTDAQA